MRSVFFLLVCALLVSSCASPPPSTPTPVEEKAPLPETPASVDGHQRLSDKIAEPTSYKLDLTIDPEKDRFSGTASISIKVHEETGFLTLHGGKLDISSALVGGKPAKVIKGDNGGLVLEPADSLSAGMHEVVIRYETTLDEVPTSLYRVQEEGRWYAFTQFEPLEARDAFPCFDDPQFKTPYTVTLRVPGKMTAISNAPEASRKNEGDLTTYTFKPTKKLPSYLVAFAVGEFDIVEAPKDALPGGVPFRVIATRGKGHMTEYALKRTPGILKVLSEYFDQPYPFQKLDLIGVPNFSAGAMENVGLVTFRERLLLVDGPEAPLRDRSGVLGVIAHELAHMWYGNLVTMAWWDDLWLNEAFATWMASHVVTEVEPVLKTPLSDVRSKNWAMILDAKKAARAIRQPIEHGGDVYNAFDGITYTKGAAFLGMLESWGGEEAFRDGVRAYMRDHAYGSATTDDLLSALEKSTKKDVKSLSESFLFQPGTPLLNLEVQCGDKTTLKVSQERYLPAGSDADQGKPWHVPVCVKHSDKAGHVQTSCHELQGKEGSFELSGACPAWVYPNSEERGYYRWLLPEKDLLALAGEHREKLSPAERAALPQQFMALLRAEKIDAAAFLKGMELLSKDQERAVVQGVKSGLGSFEKLASQEGLEKEYRAGVKRILGPHLKRIGAKAKPNEDPEAELLRPGLIRMLAEGGRDAKLLKMAKKATSDYLKGKRSIEDVRSLVPIAAKYGDRALWEKLMEKFQKASSPTERSVLLGSIGRMEDPALVKENLKLLLEGTFRSQDFWSVVGPPLGHEENQEIVWAWVQSDYDQILKTMGNKTSRRLPVVIRGTCEEEGLKERLAFFQGEKLPDGADRHLKLAEESVRQCIRFRAVHAESFRAFLKK